MVRGLCHSSVALTPVENCVYLCCVRLVIDHPATHLDPCVGFERHLLRTDHHLCSDTVAFEKTSCSRGTLQAQHLLPIPNAGHVHRRANVFRRNCRCLKECDRELADSLVEGREVSPCQVEIEFNQLHV